MKNNIFFCLLLLFIACNEKRSAMVNEEVYIINNFFLEVVEDLHLYQDQDEFKKEYYAKHTDSISMDSLSMMYHQKKKVLKYGTLLVKDELVPLTKDEKEILIEIDKDDPTVEYSIANESIKFSLDSIQNRGKYTILPKTDDYSEIGKDAVSAVRFSRVHFNKERNKAAFSYEIICGALCYSRSLILVSKDKDGKWIINKRYPIEIG